MDVKCIGGIDVFWNKPEKAAYLFIAPSVITLVIFSLVPLLASIGIGFMNLDMYFTTASFAGIDNFLIAFKDDRFWNALKNTLIFVLIEVPVQVILGLLIANVISSTTLFNKLSRAVFFLPVVCSMAAIGITWSILLDGNIGFVTYFLKKIGFAEINLFRDPKTAMGTVIAMTVWKNFGYTMSIIVVGIQGISRSYFEASEIDGANKIQQFFHITIPGLSATLGFCLITNLIGSLQVFDQVYVTTQGGPQFKTETLVQYIYKTGFAQPFNLGYASEMSVLMLIIIVGLSVPVYKKIFMGKE